MSNRTDNKRQVLKSFILILSSLLVTSLVLETGLRIIGYNPLEQILAGKEDIIRSSSVRERAYEAVPNAEGYIGGMRIRINSHGFRDKEYELSKKKGTYRIAVIGDSVTYAGYLPLEDTYTEQLEELFSESGKQVEVLNLALMGYNTLAEVITLEQIGIPFQPDLVVVGYCINDIYSSPNLSDIMKVERYRHFIYRIRLVQFISLKLDIIRGRLKIKELNQKEQFLSDNMEHIVDVSGDMKLNSMINLLKKQKEKEFDNNSLINMYLSKEHLGLLRYSLERLKKLKDEHGFDVIVMVGSSVWADEAINDINQLIYSIVEYEANRQGFRVVNTYKTFQSAGFENLMRNKNDGIHPNKLGHKLMSRLLYEYINSNINLELADTR